MTLQMAKGPNRAYKFISAYFIFLMNFTLEGSVSGQGGLKAVLLSLCNPFLPTFREAPL